VIADERPRSKIATQAGFGHSRLTGGSDHQEAAQAADVGESTVFRWLQDPDFQEAFQKAKQQTVRQAITRLQQVTGEAVDVLKKVMTDSGSPAGSRVTAARIILDTALKAVEMEDLEARVAALEARTNE